MSDQLREILYVSPVIPVIVIDRLEELDDVQEIYHNAALSDA